MKRKSLIIILLLLVGSFAFAQNVTVVTADVSSILSPTYPMVGSVRNWTGTVHFSLMEIPMADILYRIEGFKDASGFKVYALGIMWDDIGGLNKYGIYEIDTTPTATNYSYTFLNAQLPLYGERMDEIVILEEEVVF